MPTVESVSRSIRNQHSVASGGSGCYYGLHIDLAQWLLDLDGGAGPSTRPGTER